MIQKSSDLRKVRVEFEETGGDDGGFGGTPVDGPWGEIPVVSESPDGPVITDSEADLEKSWREDVQRAKERSPGGIGIALKTLLDEMFAKPVIDWKILLKRFATKLSSKTEYFMPNKRFLGSGDVLWGSKRKKDGFETLFLVADTSGSIGKNELESFVAQTINIMKEFKPKETYLIWCDTRVYEPVDVLKGPNDLWKMREAKGTGGGDFRPPFIWIEKNILGKKKIGPIIYFTDGYEQFPKLGDYGTDKYHKNVFWLIVSPRTPNNNIKIPFGTKIDLVTNV